MYLFIRSDDINQVIVADDKTGYAVASFYYQAGVDRKPLYNALDNAVKFIKLLDPPNREKEIAEAKE
jgi:hypothetical protein